jgi:hypothetical protein
VVIEHVFVTTLEPTDALRRAAEFLASGGFESTTSQAFSLDSAWTSLQMRRGRKKAASARTISQLPQNVRLDFDRGRVTVALSIAANAVWGGRSFFAITSTMDTPENPKKMKLHAELLTAIATGLEQSLAGQQPIELARAQWDQAEQAVLAAAKRRKRRILIGTFSVILIFVLIIAAIVIAANHH